MGDVSETLISLPARLPDQDANAVPRRRARHECADPGQRADVSGAPHPGRGDAARDLSEREPWYHASQLSAGSAGAVSRVVRQVPEGRATTTQAGNNK